MAGEAEQGRRLAAAIVYADKTDDEIARAAQTSVRSLRRWKRSGIPHDADPRIIKKITDACGVPYAWFTADFRRLWQLDPAAEFTAFAWEAGQQLDVRHDRRHGRGRRADDQCSPRSAP